MTRRGMLLSLLLVNFQFPDVAFAATDRQVPAPNPSVGTAASASTLILRVVPSPLLAVDQNRATVVDRIIGDWGDALAKSGAGLTQDQLRLLLNALRSDQLLAASLAGTLDGLRDVIATALVVTAEPKPSLFRTKALGDANDDLAYTPIPPCRIVDTRSGAGGFLGDNITRNWNVSRPGANFTDQGGASSDCAIPAGPAAVMANLVVTGSSQPGVLFAWAFLQPAPTASTINYAGGQTIANAIILPVAQGQAKDLAVFVSTGTHVVIDVLGYFRPPLNQATGTFEVAVGGNLALRIIPDAASPIMIAGSSANNVTSGASGATIGGGGALGNAVPGIVGICQPPGCANRVTDAFGTIGGGVANQAGNAAGTSTDATFATVGGGFENRASGNRATIGGGNSNSASASGSVVAGGGQNVASGDYSTVAGGVNNGAIGPGSTVGGGGWNGSSGLSNVATGSASTVSGGIGNLASGTIASVGGGAGNTASGAYSFAVGRGATTQTAGASPTVHDGTFVFADGNNFQFFTSAPNEFAVRASGGVRFVTAIDGTGNPTRTVAINGGGNVTFGATTRQMLNLYNFNYGIGVQTFTSYWRIENSGSDGAGGWSWFKGGVHADVVNDPGAGGFELMRLARNGNLITAGTVNGSSDVHRKTAFAPIDPKDVLTRVAGLPITSWQYRDDADLARHIGPTAQDFAAAFGLGTDDKHISMVDADGIALAAIQGLNAKVEVQLAAKDAEIGTLKRELAELRRAVEVLMARASPEGRVAQAR